MNYYIITGTTKGLGAAIKKELLKNPNNFVFALNRTSDPEDSDNFYGISCDIAVNKQIEAAFNQINEKMDITGSEKIVLINNAGVVDPIKFIHKASAEDIKKAFDVNVLGTINTTRCFLEKYIDYPGEKIIVNVSSGAAQKPMAGWSIYTATKAAVEIFTSSVALEQETIQFPTTIFAFQPGKVETPMQEYVRNQKTDNFPMVGTFVDSYNNKENFTPEFVASLLVKLLDDAESGKVYKARELKEHYNL